MGAPAIGFVKIPVSDVARAAAFYRDVLGLTEDFVVAECGWAQLSSASIPLCLYEPGKGGGSREPGGDTGIQLRVGDAAAVHAKAAEAGGTDGDLSTGDDGTVTFQARDPDGNLVQVAQLPG